MTQQDEFFTRVEEFVRTITDGLDLDLDIAIDDVGDHVRVSLDGGDGEPLLRRKGEGLDALQHLVNTAFRHEVGEKRLVVDCQDFRRAKDRELRQMVHFLIDRARTTGQPQQIGPLNSYSRRLVHLEVAEAGDMESASDGVGASKRVTITAKAKDQRT